MSQASLGQPQQPLTRLTSVKHCKLTGYIFIQTIYNILKLLLSFLDILVPCVCFSNRLEMKTTLSLTEDGSYWDKRVIKAKKVFAALLWCTRLLWDGVSLFFHILGPTYPCSNPPPYRSRFQVVIRLATHLLSDSWCMTHPLSVKHTAASSLFCRSHARSVSVGFQTAWSQLVNKPCLACSCAYRFFCKQRSQQELLTWLFFLSSWGTEGTWGCIRGVLLTSGLIWLSGKIYPLPGLLAKACFSGFKERMHIKNIWSDTAV